MNVSRQQQEQQKDNDPVNTASCFSVFFVATSKPPVALTRQNNLRIRPCATIPYLQEMCHMQVTEEGTSN